MIRNILERLLKGEISLDEAEKQLKFYQLREIGKIGKFNIGRESRKGVPEMILGEGKRPEDIVKIAKAVLQERGRVIITRLSTEQSNILMEKFGKSNGIKVEFNERARLMVIKSLQFKHIKTGGKVGIVAAGTSDIPFAEEARIIAEEMGCDTITIYDVGVAGLHRTIECLEKLVKEDVDVLIVVAGREAALPTVIASFVDIPVIGLPTSIGYGFGGKGISSLASMLQACPLGIAVVNVDGGVPAGVVAALIANRAAKFRGTWSRKKKL